jgi:hypothetical protein
MSVLIHWRERVGYLRGSYRVGAYPPELLSVNYISKKRMDPQMERKGEVHLNSEVGV